VSTAQSFKKIIIYFILFIFVWTFTASLNLRSMTLTV
jgi:hypothetical protein